MELSWSSPLHDIILTFLTTWEVNYDENIEFALQLVPHIALTT